MELACKLGGQNDTSATDVPLVEEKILAKFPDIAAFNATIKNVADDILEDFRDGFSLPWLAPFAIEWFAFFKMTYIYI